MKSIIHLPTWQKAEDALISQDESYIVVLRDDYKYGNIYNLVEAAYEEDFYYLQPRKQSTPEDPILASLCKIVNAKMYDDYIVLNQVIGHKRGGNLSDIEVHTQGDFYPVSLQQDRPIEQRNFIDHINGKLFDGCQFLALKFCNGEMELCTNSIGYYADPRDHNVLAIKRCNIFEEYSKKLWKEENQFEEIKKLLDI
jgi:hypothetical protein